MARLLTLKAAWMMDIAGNKAARGEIAMIKVVAPQHGLPGHRLGDAGAWRRRRLATISRSPYYYAQARTLRFADGPDEVHRNAIAKLELGKYATRPGTSVVSGERITDAEPHAVGAETQDGNAKDQFTEPHDDAGDCQSPNL